LRELGDTMLQISNQLYPFDKPQIMGILNCTPDSFAVHCPSLQKEDVLASVRDLLEAGARMVDVGACSTRPGSEPVSEQEEKRRLDAALSAIRSVYPDLIVSVDTFRASIAEYVIAQYGVQLINEISGLADERMVDVLARTRVPYILTYSRSDVSMLAFFAERLDWLHRAGVADVILDPGFGFAKTVEQNYTMMHQLPLLRKLNAPILVGISRKSMLYKPLDITPATALNATTAAHVLALIKGADILRVHDVKEAREAIAIVQLYKNNL